MFYFVFSDIMPEMYDLRAQFEGAYESAEEAEAKVTEIENSGLYAFVKTVC